MPKMRSGHSKPNRHDKLTSVLAVEHLGVRFGDRWIFRGLSFDVRAGQRLVLLGRNGSGKSTLARTLCGLQNPTTGKILFPTGDSRNTIGFAGLEMALYPELTVREHLELTASLRGCAPRNDELLETVGLAYASSVSAQHLSTGMKLRLKLAMAIQPCPEILILDEPSACLDEGGKKMLFQICEDQCRSGSVIIATNDPVERGFATHEIILD